LSLLSPRFHRTVNRQELDENRGLLTAPPPTEAELADIATLQSEGSV
jgi:hypothetical protein